MGDTIEYEEPYSMVIHDKQPATIPSQAAVKNIVLLDFFRCSSSESFVSRRLGVAFCIGC